MEFSKLVILDERLLTFDMALELQDEKAIPWILFADGDGLNVEEFKSELAIVKVEELYIESMDKS